MAKELKKWIDEFVENGANPADVAARSENGGEGTDLDSISNSASGGGKTSKEVFFSFANCVCERLSFQIRLFGVVCVNRN